MYDLTFMWNLKTKRQNSEKRDQICGYWRQGVGGERIGGRWSKDSNFQL